MDGILGINTKRATTKHAQTIGLLEQPHASIKQALKIKTGQRRSLWHKYVSIAVLSYNSSYHSSIGFEPSRIFHGRIPYNVLDIISGIRPQQPPIPKCSWSNTNHLSRCSKNTTKASIKYKACYDKKQTLQSSKKQITYRSHGGKWIIKGVKFRLRNFDGLAHRLSERCYPITITWYAKLATTRRKCFIACECVSSHPANRHLTYDPRHKNGNPIHKLASKTMICLPECGSVNTKSQFLTPKIIMQRHTTHPKSQCNLIYQPKKQWTTQKPHGSVPEIIFFERKSYVTYQVPIPTWNLMWTQAQSNQTKVLPSPAVQNTVYLITRNLNAMTITDNNSWAALVYSTDRVRGRSRKPGNASSNKYVTVPRFYYILCWLFPGD